MVHLVVSRTALKWNHPNLKLDWDEWVEDRLMLYNLITRRSIANQTNQDFTLITLVDEKLLRHEHSLSYRQLHNFSLPNEVIIPVPRRDSYHKTEMIDRIKWYVDKINYDDDVIITRLDSDDAIEENFIDNVQSLLIKNNTYVDIKDSFTHNLNLNKSYQSNKYLSTISPFVSVRESIREFKCIPYYYQHTDIIKYCDGVKYSKLKAIQNIHGQNLFNKCSGEEIKLDLTKYGV